MPGLWKCVVNESNPLVNLKHLPGSMSLNNRHCTLHIKWGRIYFIWWSHFEKWEGWMAVLGRIYFHIDILIKFVNVSRPVLYPWISVRFLSTGVLKMKKIRSLSRMIMSVFWLVSFDCNCWLKNKNNSG